MSRLAFVALLAACTSSPDPAALQPQIMLTAFSSQLHVNIGLQTKDAVPVSVTFRGQTVGAKTADQAGANGTFSTIVFDLDHPLIGDEPVLVSVDGLDSSISSPPPFDAVQVPPSISRSQTTTISWMTTSFDPMTWMVESSTCVTGTGAVTARADSVTFVATDWKLASGAAPTDSCPTTVRLLREREGQLNPALEPSDEINSDGYLRFEQSYDATFTSTP